MSETQRVSVLPYARRGRQINVDVLDVRSPWQIRALAASANLLFPVMLVCITAFAGCQQSQGPDTDTGTTTIEPAATDEHSAVPTQARSKALAAKDALFNRLSGRLAEVMQANGPAAAIEVCSREATEIAASVGEEQGVTIGRTAIRLRNPQNAAPEWVQPFVEQRATEPQFATLPNGDYGALLPIKLKSKCLACHGPTDAIAADVKAKLAELYPHDQATGFGEGDLRGWFWVVVPAEGTANDSAPQNAVPVSSGDEQHAARDPGPGMGHGRGTGHGPGMGRGRGMMGRGRGSDMRVDMATLHAMFDDREKIKRTVRNLPNGAEATTESDDKDIAALIQEHVPAMETRVHEDQPLPPMTFHPVFVELIRHADDYTLTYEETDRGMKVTYEAEDPFVIMLVQEHARLVSRFIKNGMEEIHKPYTLPTVNAEPPADASELQRSKKESTSALSGQLPPTIAGPDDNPTTEAKVELGKKLFFDPRLSLTGTVSCNTCHNLMEGGDDGRPSSMGIHGRIGPRNAPTVWNSVFQTSQFWDGRAADLEEQAAGPIVAQPEMGMPDHDKALERIAAIPGYRADFAKVFGEQNPVTIQNAVKAIAAFERTLITPNSPYDRYVGGDQSALTAAQVRGMQLFDSTGCTECHSGPAFNGWEAEMTEPTFQEFPRSKDSHFVATYGLDKDPGRSEITKREEDRHSFKVPTLRNIALTAPYFHNGAVESLPEAVRVMAEVELDVELTDAEVADIVAFLTALEGEFPDITLPRIPSRAGQSILEDQEPAATID